MYRSYYVALAAAVIAFAGCAAPPPSPAALALEGEWQGYLESEALSFTITAEGSFSGGGDLVTGNGLYRGQPAQVAGKVTPDSVVLVLNTALGAVDLYLQQIDSTDLRGTYGPGRSAITLRRR